MSHFAVFVAGRNVEEQLAPYDEDGEWFRASDGDPYALLGIERTATYDEVRAAAEAKLEGLPDEDDEESNDYPADGTMEEKNVYWDRCALRRTITKARDMLVDFDQRDSYDRNGPRPASKWDWWTVGGRWSDYLLLKTGARADAALKSDIDFDGMRAEALRSAEEWWRRWEPVVSGTPRPLPWRHFLDRVDASRPTRDEEGNIQTATYTIDQAREDYGAQERVAAIHAYDRAQFDRTSGQRPLLGFMGSCDRVPETREEYVRERVQDAIAVHAYVQGGVWSEDGKMGWWGMKVADRDEAEPMPWGAEFDAWLDALPDDAMITVVDCHV